MKSATSLESRVQPDYDTVSALNYATQHDYETEAISNYYTSCCPRNSLGKDVDSKRYQLKQTKMSSLFDKTYFCRISS